MKRNYTSRFGTLWISALIVALALAAGCATPGPSPTHEEALQLLRAGNFEQAIAKLEAALREDPQNPRIRADLLLARATIVNELLTRARTARAEGRRDDAKLLYEQALAADPASDAARQGLAELRRDQRHAELMKRAREAFEKGDLERATDTIRIVLAENPSNTQARQLRDQLDERRVREAMASPQLESAFREPVNLEFRDAPLKMVLEALSRSTGINYILDKDVRVDLKTSIVARETPLEDAIDLILRTNQLEKKVLGPKTLLIYPATQQKLKEYQDLVVKGFYVTSADVKQTQNLLKTVLKAQNVFIDEKANMIVIRDTPEAVRLAERLISLHDLGEPEVMLELEVLEVRRSRLLELGIQWPDQLVLTPLPSSGSTLTLEDLQNLSAGTTGATIADTIINLRKQDGDVNLLANPRVRARNREKAKIHIGERVPVVTTTATATGLVTQNVQYLDVGLKLEIEPDIQLDNEVGMRLTLEVSAITREIVTTEGLLIYQLGTRNAETALRLKDGETQILAGLISDEERKTANKVPGLGDLPLVGRLFSSNRDDQQKTEIVLAITPRLVRNRPRPDLVATEFWSGTETSLRDRPLSLGTVSSKDGRTVNVRPTKAAAAALADAPGSAPAPVAGGASFLLRGPAEVKTGQEFNVDLIVKSDGPLRGLPFQLAYDPAALEVVAVREGAFFRQGGVRTNFSSSVDPKNGRIVVGLARTGSEGAQGEDTVVTIVFRTTARQGSSELRLVAATPVAVGSRAITAALPEPLRLSVTP